MEQTNFPVLEMEMTDHSLFVSLKDEKDNTIGVLFPKELVESLVSRWQEFQNGTAPEPKMIGRYYTGHWYTKESEKAGQTAPVPERILRK